MLHGLFITSKIQKQDKFKESSIWNNSHYGKNEVQCSAKVMLKNVVINRIDSCESMLDLSIHCSDVSKDIQFLSNTSVHKEFNGIKKSEYWDLKSKTNFSCRVTCRSNWSMHCFVETAVLIKTEANYFHHIGRRQKAKNNIEESHAKVSWQRSTPFFVATQKKWDLWD